MNSVSIHTRQLQASLKHHCQVYECVAACIAVCVAVRVAADLSTRDSFHPVSNIAF